MADWCDSYELESIGAEVTHRYDAAYGAWFKDPVPISEANRTQIFSRTHASGSAQYLYRYDNYTDFLTNSNSGMFVGTDVMDGVGYVLYNQALYWEYNGYISRYSQCIEHIEGPCHLFYNATSFTEFAILVIWTGFTLLLDQFAYANIFLLSINIKRSNSHVSDEV